MKTVLITGATDGIGKESAKLFVKNQKYKLLVHGRNENKLQALKAELKEINEKVEVITFKSDFSDLDEVTNMAKEIISTHSNIDILINNAGVLKAPEVSTKYNIDLRFIVNTFAPLLLTLNLKPLFDASSRIVNLSSAAQSSIDSKNMYENYKTLSDMEAYAQSKLALTMWSIELGLNENNTYGSIIALNPGSLLATKMVKEGFGIEGNDLNKGANIIYALATEEKYHESSGLYFDNDKGNFGKPHIDALNETLRGNLFNQMIEFCQKHIN